MRRFPLAALSLLWVTGAFSIGCAHAQDDRPPEPPPFGQDPPPHRPDSDRRERINRLEHEIRELESALKGEEGTDEQRAEWKKRLGIAKRDLKERLGDAPRQDDNPRLREKMSRLEVEIQELENALKNKEAGPDQRQKWERQLEQARAQMGELRGMMKGQDKRDPGPMDRLHARLRQIDDMLAKGVGPEDRKELMAEREKIHAELGRRGGAQHAGMPHDLELHKIQMEAHELERASMDMAHRLRGIPKDKEDDRKAALDKLKEVVTKLFDVREKARAREIDLIKKRLEELTQMLDKRKENRDSIIEKRIKQLSGEADPLDW